MIRTFFKTLAILLGYLTAADVVGVVVCVVFDIVPLKYSSAGVPYAIWFVLGAFVGFLVHGTAGSWSMNAGLNWMEHPDALRTGRRVIASSIVIVVLLVLLFYRQIWSRGVAGEYFVPDSAPHTIVFLATTVAAMLVAQSTLLPDRKKNARHDSPLRRE